MQRDLQKYLLDWKTNFNRLPLLLRGARQVGKTYLIETFGREAFKNCVTVNFEYRPEMAKCFTTLNPQEIINQLRLVTGESITAGETLLFLDEIQDCPNAILAMRYFKEKLPEQHIIGAGSLLEFALQEEQFRMPVGRVQFAYLKPLSFKEFLAAIGKTQLREYIEQISARDEIPEVIHSELLSHLRKYLILGGMPAVLQVYLQSGDFAQCQQQQGVILNGYRHDFGKYATKTAYKNLQEAFGKLPVLIGQPIKYVNIDRELRARDIKQVLNSLAAAGLLHLVYANKAAGIPLVALKDEKKFKLIFLDIGLVKYAMQLKAELLLAEDLLLVNQGAITEQFVGQELLAYADPFREAELFFWHREAQGSQAEVDFVIQVNGQIIPIEVKSGVTGRLKSLRLFMQEKKSRLGVRVSQLPLSLADDILSIPLYLVSEIPRLVQSS
jgi:predicted AAA+ superfamily ATPase